MIVIYGRYPHPQLVRDGWMRRIATLERLFADRERHYVFPGDPAWAADWSDYRVHTHAAAPGATEAFLDFRFSLHHRHLAELVHAADFVYAHTSHSAQHLLPFYASGKIVTDLHGIAPEEEELQGKPGRAAFYGALEETMIRRSAALVTVTEAMAAHFRRKYPGSDRPTIQLPIVEELGHGGVQARPVRTRPVVVYVGGLQRWQNVDRMLAAVAASRDRYEFRFYTDNPDALRARAAAAGVGDAMQIATAAPEQLPAIYADADLGFVLRDDIAVNRVSCPTKLSEYLALGVIPVVALAEIGDFVSLGYRHVTVDDLIAGRLPDHATMTAMRHRNREVYEAIGARFTVGERRLRELRVDAPTSGAVDSTWLSTVERASFFPLRGAWVEIERDDGLHKIAVDDVVAARLDVTLDLPGRGPLRTLRFCPGDVPYVTSPLQAELIDENGAAHPVPLTGGCSVDAFGNWRFADRGATVAAASLPPAAMRRLRLRGEYLLLGIESLIAGTAPPPRPTGFDTWLTKVKQQVAKVPGATAAWQLVRGKPRR